MREPPFAVLGAIGTWPKEVHKATELVPKGALRFQLRELRAGDLDRPFEVVPPVAL